MSEKAILLPSGGCSRAETALALYHWLAMQHPRHPLVRWAAGLERSSREAVAERAPCTPGLTKSGKASTRGEVVSRVGPGPRGTINLPSCRFFRSLQIGAAHSVGTAVVALFSYLPPPAESWRCRLKEPRNVDSR